MKKYKKVITFTLILIFTFILIYSSYKQYNIILDILYPFQKVIDKYISKMADVKYVIFKNYEILNENKSLKQEIIKLKLELQNLKYLEYENAKLKQLLNYPFIKNIKSIQLSKVISISPNRWERYIIIDKGKNDKVNLGDLVVADGYLVGKITKIGRFSSYITLVNDINFKITARMKKTRELVFLRGNGNNIVLEYVKKEQDIRVDDIVETDNPKGIPIGKVIKVEDYPSNFFKKVEVEPFLNPFILEYVLVIKGSK